MNSFVFIHRQLIYAKCLKQTDDAWQIAILLVNAYVIGKRYINIEAFVLINIEVIMITIPHYLSL